MAETMVTARMSEDKKERAGRILRDSGLNASKAINLMYDRIIEDGDASLLLGRSGRADATRWKIAAQFVDGLTEKRATRFDEMSKAQIRGERLRDRGML